jgi:poly(A) polymerase
VDGLRRILDAIKNGGGEARCVGGCVRDALLGHTVGEVDIACTLPPEKTTEILKQAGLKVVPTGIAHGTITAIADHVGYEITTLRRDVETDGRRATVAFTDNWQEDAARRDFTFNALYVDADGNIYDYFDGRTDLAAGRVKFIGDAHERIREDVLRILRYFRFFAWFGRGEPNTEAVTACRELADLIPQLSVERVWREIVKLLSADNPLPAWTLMVDCGVVEYVLPEAVNAQMLENLLAVERKYKVMTAPMVRLAALMMGECVESNIPQRLKLSRKETERLATLTMLPDKVRGSLEPVAFRRILYMYGVDNARDAVVLVAAQNATIDLATVLSVIDRWENPVFPLQGADLLKMGVAASPKVGDILRAVEDWWISQDFKPTRAACLEWVGMAIDKN